MRNEARAFIASLRKYNSLHISPIFLRKSYGSKWKVQAESKLCSAEIVLVYDNVACEESENAQWEIDRSVQLKKTVIKLSRQDIDSRNVGALQAAYDFAVEFDNCFQESNKRHGELIDLYKIMVSSSEQLIQRRQITNGFFFTAIGTIIGASGFAVKEKLVSNGGELVLILPTAIGLLMCRSWGNLIENYGKLNAGKFKVIHKLEHQLSAKIFAAEWIALGRGLRKEKYQSFTTTEKNVPRHFSFLLWAFLVFILCSADWHAVLSKVSEVRRDASLFFEWRQTPISVGGGK